MNKMLEVKELEVFYGSIHAIKNVSFEVNEGEIVTLIGANGAGKTTIMHAISALLKPKNGVINFDGTDITHVPAHKILKMRLAHVPEGRHVFSQMTVLENLELGAFTINNKADIQADMRTVFESFPRLEERKKQLAGTLSGGEQQMLAIGRAIMSKPKMMLLDEPTMGLSPLLVQEIFSIIRKVNSLGVTVLLVEQNAKMALELADRAYVLETGRIVMQGDAKELSKDKRVKQAYLGG